MNSEKINYKNENEIHEIKLFFQNIKLKIKGGKEQ